MTATALAIALPEDDDADDVSAVFLPSPPAPPPRRRNRPPQPGTPASEAPTVTVMLSTAERNRTVLRMHLAGKTFDQIGTHFGKSRRTIATYFKEAKTEQAKTFRQNTAEDIAAEIESKFASSYARWMGILDRAQATGNLKLEITALARMDQSQVHRVKALQGIGYFDHVDFKPLTDDQEDATMRGRSGAKWLQASLRHMVDYASGKTDNPEMDYLDAGSDTAQDEPAY